LLKEQPFFLIFFGLIESSNQESLNQMKGKELISPISAITIFGRRFFPFQENIISIT
jgi:hypothetical protein